MLAFTACVHHNKTNEASNSQTARIAFSDTLHDFGICAEDKAVQQYLFIFKNTGDVPAAVVDVALSCHCLSADYTRGIVQPGEAPAATSTKKPVCASIVRAYTSCMSRERLSPDRTKIKPYPFLLIFTCICTECTATMTGYQNASPGANAPICMQRLTTRRRVYHLPAQYPRGRWRC